MTVQFILEKAKQFEDKIYRWVLDDYCSKTSLLFCLFLKMDCIFIQNISINVKIR